MLAGKMQIRSPSGSYGWYTPKINPGIKKQPVFLQAALWIFRYLFASFVRLLLLPRVGIANNFRTRISKIFSMACR